MRVLVTGASGFIGAHLCHTLIEAGHDVLGIVRQRAGAWRLDAFAKDCPTIEGDLADVSSLEPQVAQFAPEVLVHLGWSGVAGQSRNDASQALNVDMQNCMDAGMDDYITKPVSPDMIEAIYRCYAARQPEKSVA